MRTCLLALLVALSSFMYSCTSKKTPAAREVYDVGGELFTGNEIRFSLAGLHHDLDEGRFRWEIVEAYDAKSKSLGVRQHKPASGKPGTMVGCSVSVQNAVSPVTVSATFTYDGVHYRLSAEYRQNSSEPFAGEWQRMNLRIERD